MNQNLINGNKKVRAATQEMLDILAEERAKKKSVKYTEASTNTGVDHGESSIKEGPRRVEAPKFNMDSILAEKPQDGPVGLEMKNGPSEAGQVDLPEWATQLFAMHAQLPPSTATGAFPPTALGKLGLSSSGFSTSDILNSGMSSPTIPSALPTADPSTRKRAVPWNEEPNETGPRTSAKKFVQTAASAKSPEMAVPILSTSTTWNSDQFNAFFQFCQQLPGSVQGLLNSLPQTEETTTGSQDALTAFQTDNQHFADSVLGLNSGQSAASWNGGTGALSGSTQGLGLSQLLGLLGNISAATTPSISQSSSSPSGGPHANTADTDGNTEGF